MDNAELTMAWQVARMTGAFQRQATGYAPSAVTVVLSGDTLVSTLHDALTPAERILALSPAGAARVQAFHRRLFANSVAPLRQEIKKITGIEMREAAAEVDTTTGTLVHAFTSGAPVQVVLLAQGKSEDARIGDRLFAGSDDEQMDEALDAFELAASNLALVMSIGEGVTETPGDGKGAYPGRM
jgi:uncharacterized protein YbcI